MYGMHSDVLHKQVDMKRAGHRIIESVRLETTLKIIKYNLYMVSESQNWVLFVT